MRPLFVFHDPPLDGADNMARDEHLLRSEELRPAVLRIYRWSPPTISLGYFQRYTSLVNLPPELRELAVVRRQTGGGAILHDQEITYCLVVDDSLPITSETAAALYRLVHACWREAIACDVPQVERAPDSLPFPSPRSGPFFCFQRPGQTDLLLSGGKLLGSAQRRTAGRVLQHGSLLLGQRFIAHPGAHLNNPQPDVIERWTTAFISGLGIALALEPLVTTWSGEQLMDVLQRRKRYTDQGWTQRR